MIKFIISDVDGTLISEHGNNGGLDPNIFKLIKECRKRGILFAIASGRAYSSLKRVFLPVWRDIYFLAENGNVIMHQDKLIHTLPIPAPIVKSVAEKVIHYDDCILTFSCATKLLMFEEPRWLPDAIIYGNKTASVIIESLDEVYAEDIVKIGVAVDIDVVDKREAEFQEIWGHDLLITKSGSGWVDFCLSGKGAATRRIMDDFGLTPDQVMAFGDNYNDVEMFGAVGHSFAMTDAADGVKAHAKHTTAVVTDVIEHFLNTGDILVD